MAFMVWRAADHCSHAKISRSFDNFGSVIFSLFMLAWTVVFLEKWKRYESELGARWGMTSGEQSEEQVDPLLANKSDRTSKGNVDFKWNRIN